MTMAEQLKLAMRQRPSWAVAAGAASIAMMTFPGTAQAFTFTTNFEGSAGQEDAFLRSVVLDTGETIEAFSYIERATIVQNDEYVGGNSGAASADKGDKATTGISQESVTAEQIALNLGTSNLNNIIDTEDSGSFQIDLHFAKAMDNLLIWERGMNSDLAVQALDAEGKLVGNYFKINRTDWFDAGFSIDTLEISGAQAVGSLGINFASDLGVEGAISSVRFFSESSFNGPDWKFVGTDSARDIPEAGMVMGLGVLVGAALLKQRRLA